MTLGEKEKAEIKRYASDILEGQKRTKKIWNTWSIEE
jgi:hypothetical protein